MTNFVPKDFTLDFTYDITCGTKDLFFIINEVEIFFQTEFCKYLISIYVVYYNVI